MISKANLLGAKYQEKWQDIVVRKFYDSKSELKAAADPNRLIQQHAMKSLVRVLWIASRHGCRSAPRRNRQVSEVPEGSSATQGSVGFVHDDQHIEITATP